jgi:hypothetical protein
MFEQNLLHGKDLQGIAAGTTWKYGARRGALLAL